jgi:hypothetical protein
MKILILHAIRRSVDVGVTAVVLCLAACGGGGLSNDYDGATRINTSTEPVAGGPSNDYDGTTQVNTSTGPVATEISSQAAASTGIKSTSSEKIEEFHNYWTDSFLSVSVDYDRGIITGKTIDPAYREQQCSPISCWTLWHCSEHKLDINVNGKFLNSRVLEMHFESDPVLQRANCVSSFELTGEGTASPQGSPWVGEWNFKVSVGRYSGEVNVPVKACMSSKNPALPVYHARQVMPGAIDSIYTSHVEAYENALSHGYIADDQGLPVFRVESQIGWSQEFSNAVAYNRYWYAPWTDHINVSSESDINILNSVGFTQETQEGFIYAAPVPNTVPLYRLWRNWGNDDVEHLTTTGIGLVNELIGAGWNSDGIVGYVCSQ